MRFTARVWPPFRLRLFLPLALFAGCSLAAAPLWSQGPRLEVIPAAAATQFELTRGREKVETLTVRNTGDADLPVEAILFAYKKDGKDQPPELDLPAVVGLNGMTLPKTRTTTLFLRFPGYPRVAEYSGELYLKRPGVTDGPERFHSFTIKVQEPVPRLLSTKAAGWLASIFAAATLFLTVFVRGKENRNFFQSPDGFYSVCRFQVWLWTVAITFAYAYLYLSFGPNIVFPESIWALLGISVGSIGVAKHIAVRNGTATKSPGAGGSATPAAAGAQPAAPANPSPRIGPLTSMLSDDGTPSLMRLQMFIWTVVTAIFFLRQVYSTGTLWDVPSSLLVLMGISHGGYLIDKGAKRPAP